MVTNPNDPQRFAAKNYGLTYTTVTRREKPPTGSVKAHGRLYRDDIAFIARTLDPAIALLIEMIRQKDLNSVVERDGWVLLSEESYEALCLTDRHIRRRAVSRLVAAGCLETRGKPGHKLQYRLIPKWNQVPSEPVKPIKPAKVVDLAAMRKAKRRKRGASRSQPIRK